MAFPCCSTRVCADHDGPTEQRPRRTLSNEQGVLEHNLFAGLLGHSCSGGVASSNVICVMHDSRRTSALRPRRSSLLGGQRIAEPCGPLSCKDEVWLASRSLTRRWRVCRLRFCIPVFYGASRFNTWVY